MSSSAPTQTSQKKSTRREIKRAAKALEAQPLFVNDLLADRSEEARKAKRALCTRSRNRLHLPRDGCILLFHLPEPLLQTTTGEPEQPPVTITVTNPDGLTLYPHDKRTWSASAPPKPAASSSKQQRADVLALLADPKSEILEVMKEAHACPRVSACGLEDERSGMREAIVRMAREMEAGRLDLSSEGPFAKEERLKARCWLEAAYQSYDELVEVVYHLVRCERKSLELGLLPALFEQVVRQFPSYGRC